MKRGHVKWKEAWIRFVEIILDIEFIRCDLCGKVSYHTCCACAAHYCHKHAVGLSFKCLCGVECMTGPGGTE